MPTKDDLPQMSAVHLAAWCRKLAEDPATEESIAENARKLKHEWALLQIPTPIDYKTKKELDAKEAALRLRMIEFLTYAL